MPAIFVLLWAGTGDWIPMVVAIAGRLVVVCYVRGQRRLWPRLDPSADARTYHAVLLERIDGRIRLYQGAPYWCGRVVPLHTPFVFLVDLRGVFDTVATPTIAALTIVLSWG